MTWFKLLIGFTMLNVCIQLYRGNDALDVSVGIIIFLSTILAYRLWEQ